jgi:hypothetical protein
MSAAMGGRNDAVNPQIFQAPEACKRWGVKSAYKKRPVGFRKARKGNPGAIHKNLSHWLLHIEHREV